MKALEINVVRFGGAKILERREMRWNEFDSLDFCLQAFGELEYRTYKSSRKSNSYTVGGELNWYNLENSMEIPQKVENGTAM